MKLGPFITTQMEAILCDGERFAASLGPVTEDMGSIQLRDHAKSTTTAPWMRAARSG